MVNLIFLDKVLAVSEEVKKSFSFFYYKPRKVYTLHNALDHNEFNPNNFDNSLRNKLNINSGEIIIGNFGSLDKNKGQKQIIDAIYNLKYQGIKNLKCIFCGIGPLKEQLQKVAEQKGLSKDIIFAGHVEDLRPYYKILDIYISSSKIESFSITSLEAMSMQIPVIATDVGGISELVTKAVGVLVDYGSISQLSIAIENLVKDRDLRLKLGHNGRLRVIKNFSMLGYMNHFQKIILD